MLKSSQQVTPVRHPTHALLFKQQEICNNLHILNIPHRFEEMLKIAMRLKVVLLQHNVRDLFL